MAEKLLDSHTIDLHPTYFETVTAMAFLIFAEAPTDIVVLEVGLGGRLDATNVVHPELCVITQIDFDHEAFLGISLEAIAGEKAGIMKPGVPAVFSRQRPEVTPVLEKRAVELSVPVARTADWTVSELELDPRGCRFTLTDDRALHIRCPLAGEHQVENAATAAIALARLGLSDSAIEAGIAAARWPGRLELISERPEILIDGAHNPAGARALAAYLDRFYRHRTVRMIYGAMRDKAVEEVCGILFPRASQVVVTAPQQPRALYPEAILQIASHPDLRTAPGLRQALDLVREEAGPEDMILITGSLYLVGEARALFGV
jgi:dihydrofolate synthase/folylpolyglutamate synthase